MNAFHFMPALTSARITSQSPSEVETWVFLGPKKRNRNRLRKTPQNTSFPGQKRVNMGPFSARTVVTRLCVVGVVVVAKNASERGRRGCQRGECERPPQKRGQWSAPGASGLSTGGRPLGARSAPPWGPFGALMAATLPSLRAQRVAQKPANRYSSCAAITVGLGTGLAATTAGALVAVVAWYLMEGRAVPEEVVRVLAKGIGGLSTSVHNRTSSPSSSSFCSRAR